MSRYLTLGWTTFVLVTWSLSTRHPDICSWFRYYPYGYSVVILTAHAIMVLRIHSLYNKNPRVLFVMLGLALADFAVQVSIVHLVKRECQSLGKFPHRQTCVLGWPPQILELRISN